MDTSRSEEKFAKWIKSESRLFASEFLKIMSDAGIFSNAILPLKTVSGQSFTRDFAKIGGEVLGWSFD